MAAQNKLEKVLKGGYYVFPIGSALRRAIKLFDRKARPYFVLKRHVLKLRFFPSGIDERNDGDLADLNWDWIKGLGDINVGELRIDDEIGGHDNLRVIFYVADKTIDGEPLPRIWILTVIQKKEQRFSPGALKTFKAHRGIIFDRYYR